MTIHHLEYLVEQILPTWLLSFHHWQLHLFLLALRSFNYSVPFLREIVKTGDGLAREDTNRRNPTKARSRIAIYAPAVASGDSASRKASSAPTSLLRLLPSSYRMLVSESTHHKEREAKLARHAQ